MRRGVDSPALSRNRHLRSVAPPTLQALASLSDPLRCEHSAVCPDGTAHIGTASTAPLTTAVPSAALFRRVEVVSDAFSGKPTVARHRAVYKLLEQEIAEGVHALSLRTLAPGEK